MARKGPYKKEIKAKHPLVRDVLALIERSGWTDYEVEDAAGVSRAYISQLRNGRRNEVSVVCLDAICGVFSRKLGVTRLDKRSNGATRYVPEWPDNAPKPRAARRRPVRPTKQPRGKRLAYAGAEE